MAKYGHAPKPIETGPVNESYSDEFLIDLYRHNAVRSILTRAKLKIRRRLGITAILLDLAMIPGVVGLVGLGSSQFVFTPIYIGIACYCCLVLGAILLLQRLSKPLTYHYEDATLLKDRVSIVIFKENSYRLDLRSKKAVDRIEAIDSKREMCSQLLGLARSNNVYDAANRYIAIEYRLGNRNDTDDFDLLINEAIDLLYLVIAFGKASAYLMTRLMEYLLAAERYAELKLMIERYGEKMPNRITMKALYEYSAFGLHNLDCA